MSPELDTIPTTPETALLPDMQGSGLVRDLRQAASMTITEGAALQASLSQYVPAIPVNDTSWRLVA